MRKQHKWWSIALRTFPRNWRVIFALRPWRGGWHKRHRSMGVLRWIRSQFVYYGYNLHVNRRARKEFITEKQLFVLNILRRLNNAYNRTPASMYLYDYDDQEPWPCNTRGRLVSNLRQSRSIGRGNNPIYRAFSKNYNLRSSRRLRRWLSLNFFKFFLFTIKSRRRYRARVYVLYCRQFKSTFIHKRRCMSSISVLPVINYRFGYKAVAVNSCKNKRSEKLKVGVQDSLLNLLYILSLNFVTGISKFKAKLCLTGTFLLAYTSFVFLVKKVNVIYATKLFKNNNVKRKLAFRKWQDSQRKHYFPRLYIRSFFFMGNYVYPKFKIKNRASQLYALIAQFYNNFTCKYLNTIFLTNGLVKSSLVQQRIQRNAVRLSNLRSTYGRYLAIINNLPNSSNPRALRSYLYVAQRMWARYSERYIQYKFTSGRDRQFSGIKRTKGKRVGPLVNKLRSKVWGGELNRKRLSRLTRRIQGNSKFKRVFSIKNVRKFRLKKNVRNSTYGLFGYGTKQVMGRRFNKYRRQVGKNYKKVNKKIVGRIRVAVGKKSYGEGSLRRASGYKKKSAGKRKRNEKLLQKSIKTRRFYKKWRHFNKCGINRYKYKVSPYQLVGSFNNMGVKKLYSCVGLVNYIIRRRKYKLSNLMQKVQVKNKQVVRVGLTGTDGCLKRYMKNKKNIKLCVFFRGVLKFNKRNLRIFSVRGINNVYFRLTGYASTKFVLVNRRRLCIKYFMRKLSRIKVMHKVVSMLNNGDLQVFLRYYRLLRRSIWRFVFIFIIFRVLKLVSTIVSQRSVANRFRFSIFRIRKLLKQGCWRYLMRGLVYRYFGVNYGMGKVKYKLISGRRYFVNSASMRFSKLGRLLKILHKRNLGNSVWLKRNNLFLAASCGKQKGKNYWASLLPSKVAGYSYKKSAKKRRRNFKSYFKYNRQQVERRMCDRRRFLRFNSNVLIYNKKRLLNLKPSLTNKYKYNWSRFFARAYKNRLARRHILKLYLTNRHVRQYKLFVKNAQVKLRALKKKRDKLRNYSIRLGGKKKFKYGRLVRSYRLRLLAKRKWSFYYNVLGGFTRNRKFVRLLRSRIKKPVGTESRVLFTTNFLTMKNNVKLCTRRRILALNKKLYYKMLFYLRRYYYNFWSKKERFKNTYTSFKGLVLQALRLTGNIQTANRLYILSYARRKWLDRAYTSTVSRKHGPVGRSRNILLLFSRLRFSIEKYRMDVYTGCYKYYKYFIFFRTSVDFEDDFVFFHPWSCGVSGSNIVRRLSLRNTFSSLWRILGVLYCGSVAVEKRKYEDISKLRREVEKVLSYKKAKKVNKFLTPRKNRIFTQIYEQTRRYRLLFRVNYIYLVPHRLRVVGNARSLFVGFYKKYVGSELNYVGYKAYNKSPRLPSLLFSALHYNIKTTLMLWFFYSVMYKLVLRIKKLMQIFCVRVLQLPARVYLFVTHEQHMTAQLVGIYSRLN